MLYTTMKVFCVDDMPYPVDECAKKNRFGFDKGYSIIQVNYGTSDEEFPTNIDMVCRWLLNNGAQENEQVLIVY